MSKSYATYLELECGEGFGCNRQATDLKANWETSWQGKEEVDRYRASLVCGIHRGAAKRAAKGSRFYSRQPEPNFLPTDTRPDLVSLILAERKDRHDAAIVKANAQRAEAALVAEARFAEAWVARSTEPEYTIERGSERKSYDDHFRDGYTISPNGNKSSWDSLVVEVEQDGREPAVVSIRSNGRMSPDKARALAKTLILAANMAEERDITNGPA